ncbi:Potassium channel subfamily K member 1, partial [Biomphalaria glabrata]
MTRKKLTWCATHPLCRLFTHVAIFFGYLCGGAAIFMHLESPREEALVNSLKTHRFNFLANNSCVS